MNTWQKVINVCFTVIVTLLIYQNQQLEKQINAARIDLMDQLILNSKRTSFDACVESANAISPLSSDWMSYKQVLDFCAGVK
jgi:hypothetical protein